MEKKNKNTLVLTAAVMLLPIAAGIILWNKLPAEIATHFDLNGNADGYSNKVFTVIVLPFILLMLHLICVAGTSADPKNKNISGRINALVFWVCPVISTVIYAALYSKALRFDIDVVFIVMLLNSLMFIIVGNYLPKCRQNYTIGIKLPWTLDDENNWNRTHRIGGRIWVIGGFIMLLNTLLHLNGYISIIVIMVVIILPMIYSLYLYKSKNE